MECFHPAGLIFGGFEMVRLHYRLGNAISESLVYQSDLFAVLLFIAQIWGIVELKMPVRLNCPASNGRENSLLHFMTGSFVVLMSTPCTAPYLGTAIGFALAGSYFDLLPFWPG